MAPHSQHHPSSPSSSVPTGYIHRPIPNNLRQEIFPNPTLIPDHIITQLVEWVVSVQRTGGILAGHDVEITLQKADKLQVKEPHEDFWAIFETMTEYADFLNKVQGYYLEKRKNPRECPKYEELGFKFVPRRQEEVKGEQGCGCYSAELAKETVEHLVIVDPLNKRGSTWTRLPKDLTEVIPMQALDDLHALWHEIKATEAGPKSFVELVIRSYPVPDPETYERAIPNRVLMQIYYAFKEIKDAGRSFVLFTWQGDDPDRPAPATV
ncbi:hypothetical protein EG329_011617 [Mollisiaceae sp. DMI_Dod_QoI]|nr:hypothetical protein EG329_011617 [Helotiales sp. DMI_Dod_QoI]